MALIKATRALTPYVVPVRAFPCARSRVRVFAGFYGGLRPMFLQFPKRFVLENDPPFNHVSVPRARPGAATFNGAPAAKGGARAPVVRVSTEQAAQVARSVVSGAASVLLDAPSRSLKVCHGRPGCVSSAAAA